MYQAYLPKLKNFIITNKYPLILFFITLVVCITNYKQGVWLSGWDNLHPEFNFRIYWTRILNSVWQEHQGLGAVATQAHASEIPRVLTLHLLDIFFPVHFLRWAYAFLMLIIGPLGIYYLAKELFNNDSKKRAFAFVGGLYYLLNWGTLQHFYAPLEMFLTLYGYIGWLFLYLFKYLKSGSFKDYIILSILTFFSMPMAHTPTLWFAYFFFVGVVCLSYLILNPKFSTIKKELLVLLANISINAFWLLPTAYFAFNHAENVSSAKITRLFSEEAILHNQEYANILDIAILKGYLFNWLVFENHGFQPIFLKWLQYLGENTGVVYLGYALYAVMVIGIVIATIKINRNYLYFVFIYFFSTFFLLMDTPPFGNAFEFLQNHVPLFKEAIRLPFTKFSLQLMMAYSLFLAFGSYSIYAILDKIFKLIKVDKVYVDNGVRYFVTATLTIFILFFSLPAITGNLIGNISKVDYPSEYFEAFDYLNQKSEIRIATLPAHFLFGWLYFDWEDNNLRDASYQGAGFTWFLSKNPILEREFDRWFPQNESFYNEYQYAIYSQDANLLEKVLSKYNINYILYDKSITVPYSERSLFYEETDAFLNKLEYLTLDKQFGHLKIYKFKNLPDNTGFVSAPLQYQSVSSVSNFSNVDKINNTFATYYDRDNASSYYPFSDDSEIAVSQDNSIYINLPENLIPNDLSFNMGSYLNSLVIPANIRLGGGILSIDYIFPEVYSSSGKILFAESLNNYLQEIPVSENSQILLNSDFVEAEGFSTPVYLQRENELLVFESISANTSYIGENIYSAEVSDCAGGDGEYGKELGIYPDSVIVKSFNKNACLNFEEPLTPLEPLVYEITFEYRNSIGSRALYCLSKDNSGECVNKKYINAPYSSENFVKYTDYIYLDGKDDLELSLIIETLDKQKEQSVEFRNIYIYEHKILDKNNFVLNPLALSIDSPSIPLEAKDFPLRVDLSPFDRFGKKYIPGNKEFNSVVQNCDSVNNSFFERTLGEDEYGLFYKYKATDAIACDALELENVHAGGGYIITFDTKNLSYKGLDICLLGREINKCYINDRLKGGKETFILPPYVGSESFALSIGNQSIGSKSSENKLYSVDVEYIPYKLLKEINITNQTALHNNQIVLVDSKRLAPNKYEFKLGAPDIKNNENSNNSGLIMLSQAYEPNWGLYYADKCLFGLKSVFSCKKVNSKEANHVLANNWQNGWLLYPESKSYLILFEPQKWQTIGSVIFLGFVTGVMAMFVVYRHKK